MQTKMKSKFRNSVSMINAKMYFNHQNCMELLKTETEIESKQLAAINEWAKATNFLVIFKPNEGLAFK